MITVPHLSSRRSLLSTDCGPDSFLDETAKECVPCPGFRQNCTSCCSAGFSCINNYCVCPTDSIYFDVCQPQGGVFITASQIALSAALVMGIAALAMVVYRLCSKPRYLSARHRQTSRNVSSDLFSRHNNLFRASLSSIQISVMSKLRDRPPTYENQSTSRTISLTVDRQPETSIESPPSYDHHRTHTHLPPPYNEIIIAPAYLNSSFVTETTTQDSVEGNSNTKISRDMNLSIKN